MKAKKKFLNCLVLFSALGVVSVSLLASNIASFSSGDYKGYTCYIPTGETEMSQIIVSDSSHDNNKYKTRGTITAIDAAGTQDTSYTRVMIQRTNGEDGSKSSMMLYQYPWSICKNLSVGNVIDVSGTYKLYNGTPQLSYKDGDTITVAQEANPNPVEAWEMTATEFKNATFTYKDVNRLVKIKDAQIAKTTSNSGSGYSYYINNYDGLKDKTNTSDTIDLRYQAFEYNRTIAIQTKANTACNNNSTVDVTGFIGYNGSSTKKFFVLVNNEFNVNVTYTPPVGNTKTIEIYAVNDFHGAVDVTADDIGIEKYGTYLKSANQKQNTLMIDSGDTWQGSLNSNKSKGKLLSDVYNYVRFDARTIGNHDFDWGIDAMKDNASYESYGYVTPSLAGNVYDYNFSTKTMGTVQQKDIGGEYVVQTLENGLKVGILGTIGQAQMTSICSNLVSTIGFKENIQSIKDIATKLKNDEKCDVIIASTHAPEEEVKSSGLKDYVDLVLCAHSHERKYSYEDQLYFAQFGGSGNCLGHVTLTYDLDDKDVTNTKVEMISKSAIDSAVTSTDATIHNIYTSYASKYAEEANEVVASNVTGDFTKDNALPNIMAEAIYNECKAEKVDVKLVYVNDSRDNLKGFSSWKYTDVFTAFPFDNEVYVLNVPGSEIKSQISKYNHMYRDSDFTASIDEKTLYPVAMIDFLAFHINENRYYNYFKEGTKHVLGKLEYNYRDIVKNFLKSNGYNTGKAMSPTDFDSSLWRFDKTQLTFSF